MPVSITQNSVTITPTSEIGLSILHLRELVADSTFWRAIVDSPNVGIDDIKTLVAADTASRANALERVYPYQILDEQDNTQAEPTFPSCIIDYQVGAETHERYAPGAFEVFGAMYLEFCINIPDDCAGSPGVAYIDAAEKISAIARELLQPPVQEEERYIIDRLTLIDLSEVESNRRQGLRAFRSELLVQAQSADG